jgi:FtsP/CotA-like multicopper oxidase with cupredoxin domain
LSSLTRAPAEQRGAEFFGDGIQLAQGERVRIRLVNIGMDHHPMHIHGNQFYVTGTAAAWASPWVKRKVRQDL